MIDAKLNEAQIRQFERRLETFANELENPTEANRQASIALYGWTIRNYDREGRDIGGWAPLAPATVAQKERIGKEKMLVRTGQLRQSFVPFHSKDNAGVGSELEYSAAHQYGVPDNNLPARPMLPPREVVLDIGLRVYGQYVARAAQRANR